LFIRSDSQPKAGAPEPWLDEAIAETWRNGNITRPADLFPLPVLGIPGWWPANENASFYDDREIFRPARSARLQT
jgi:hypothetical protein